MMTRRTNEKKVGKLVIYGSHCAPIRILIPCDSLGATLSIAFLIPLTQDIELGRVCVCAGAGINMGPDPSALINQFNPTHLVLSRAHGREVERLVACWNKPYLYQVDDDLLAIPEDMGPEIKSKHGASDVLESREKLMRKSDKIYASTEYLKESLGTRFPKSKIVTGLHAPYLGKRFSGEGLIKRALSQIGRMRHGESQIKIGYMGSRGHLRDLEMVIPSLKNQLRNNPLLRFETFGTVDVSEAFRDCPAQFRHHKPEKDYIQFLNKLKTLGWHYGLAPLVDDEFNRCKTPSKFIEYSAAGIITVASNLEPYKCIKNGETGYLVDSENWGNTLDLILALKAKDILKKSQTFCETHYSLSQMRERLFKVLDL